MKQGAFKDSRIKELYFTDCDLYEIDSPDLMGLESSLELLDLSGNNLTYIPNLVFQQFDYLRTLIYRENRIKQFDPSKIITQ